MLKLYFRRFRLARASARALQRPVDLFQTGSLDFSQGLQAIARDILKGITITKLCQELDGRFE